MARQRQSGSRRIGAVVASGVRAALGRLRRDPPACGSPSDDRAALLRCCVLNELTPWAVRAPDPARIAAEHARLNVAHPSIFLLDLGPGGARVVGKPAFPSQAPRLLAVCAHRAELYAAFLSAAVAAHGLSSPLRIAVDVHDDATDHAAAPVFGFQKRRGAATVLLPDVDLIRGEPDLDRFADRRPYEAKAARGVFAGSTTGPGAVTTEALADGTIPRIRAAFFFRGREEVDFRLPKLVQCDSPAVETRLRELGFGVGALSWPEQLESRFLLSMDGNGATCSRIATALASNSVLLKYESEHVLFYSVLMQPWLHYVPVSGDEEVLDAIRLERRHPGYFRTVAAAGTALARAVLTRSAQLRYAAELLEAYRRTVLDRS